MLTMTTPDLDRLHAALSAEDPLTWVVTGDSITHGLVHTQGERNYAEHLHELIRGELGRRRDALINTAITGNRLVQILEDFSRRVRSWNPDIVMLMIGTNDCSDQGVFPQIAAADFATSLSDFIRRVRDAGGIPVLQTPPAINPSAAPERARIPEFAQAIRDVAAQENIILVDHFSAFAKHGGDGVPWRLLNDPFHPNAAGHALLTLEIARVLGLSPDPSRTLPLLQARVGAARQV